MIDLRPSHIQQQIALFLAVCMVTLTAVVELNPSTAISPHPIVGVVYGMTVGFLNICAAWLLLIRLQQYPYRTSGTLVGIAVCYGVLNMTYALVLPDGLGFTHPFGASIYLAGWLWISARYLWVVGAFIYIYRSWRADAGLTALAYDVRVSLFGALGVALVTIGVPVLISTGRVLSAVPHALVTSVLILDFVVTTLLVITTKARTLGQLYLSIAGFAGVCELLLSAASVHRYTLSWYASRVCGITEAMVFFLALTVQTWPLLIKGGVHEPDHRGGRRRGDRRTL